MIKLKAKVNWSTCKAIALYEIRKIMQHVIRRGEQPFALTKFLFVADTKVINISKVFIKWRSHFLNFAN